MAINVKRLCVNFKDENTYVVYDDTKECVIIDCGCKSEEEKDSLANLISDLGLTPKHLICTHFHLDHVFGNEFVKGKYGLDAEVSEGDKPLHEMMHYQTVAFGLSDEECQVPAPIYTLCEGSSISFGQSTLSVISTPGHSPGGVAFYSAESKLLFSGDTLLKGCFGATNLPGGRLPKLARAIRDNILTLPDDTAVYPGHGEQTTIGDEKESNPIIGEIAKLKK